jgi:hypothetical protein
MRRPGDGNGLAAVFCIDDLLSQLSRHIATEAISEQDEGGRLYDPQNFRGHR